MATPGAVAVDILVGGVGGAERVYLGHDAPPHASVEDYTTESS